MVLRLLIGLGEDATNALLLPHVCLHGLRSMACCCHTLTVIVRAHLLSPHFCVGDADATLDNARFTAALGRTTLRTVGPFPVLECARYRSLTRLKVGAMGTTAALYFGAVVADCDCTVRLANGNMCKDLKPLRESSRICMRGDGREGYRVGVTDLAALLGALSLNHNLTRLDLSGNSLGGMCVPLVLELLISGQTSIQSLGEGGLNIKGNGIGDEGWVALLAGICGSKRCKITSVDVSGLCNDLGQGTYTTEGITAIADALRVNGSLTALDLSSNYLMDEGVSAVCKAIQSNKETKLASLNFQNNKIGPVGANAVAAMVAATGSLTVTNLLNNGLDAESAKMLAGVAKQKGISLCGIRRDQTTADFCKKCLQPPDAILLASDLSQAIVTGSLTKIE